MFDSGFSLVQARNLDGAIRKTTDKKVRYLINSHDHSDHVFGNSYFWQRYSSTGLVIISHEICRDNLLKNGPRRLKEYREARAIKMSLLSIEIKGPNTTYSDPAIRIEIEGRKVVLSHPPTGAHTLGDTVLFLPDQDTIFAGDVIWNRFFPNLEDANLEGWTSYLDGIDLTEYKKIVPGHGEVCGSERAIEFKKYLAHVRLNLLEVDSKGRRDQNLRSCFLVPGSERWRLGSIIDYNVEQIFGKSRV